MSDLTEITDLLQSLSGPGALLAALAALRHAKGAHREARGANRATNDVKPGDPDQRTLRERVVTIEDDLGEFRVDYRRDQRRLTDQHMTIQHELGKLTGSVDALLRD